MTIKKVSSALLLIFTLGCLYFMSKGVVGISAAYFLITFNVVRVIFEVFASRVIADKLKISDKLKSEIPRKVGHMLVCFITFSMIYYSFKNTIHIVLYLALATIVMIIATNMKWYKQMVSRKDMRHDNLYCIPMMVGGFGINAIFSLINPAFNIPMVLGFMTLGLGDPMACFIGKAFGKHKIYKNKTLEGFIGFIIGATIAMYIFSSLSIVKLLIIAFAGAITELFSDKYDNLLIQLVVATIAFVIL